jgi:transketolase
METIKKTKKVVKKAVVEKPTVITKKVKVAKGPTKEELLAEAHECRLASEDARRTGDEKKAKELSDKFNELLEKALSV